MVWFLGKKEKKPSQIEEEPEEEFEKEEEVEEQPKSSLWFTVFLSFLILFLALIPRLYFLFFVSDPQNPGDGWYGDVYHHWQIAYLTREVGLSHGFLRLWDLKGMEYFWGPLHPVLMMLLFKLTGSVSIVVARVLSLVFGSLLIVAIFLIVAKFWNRSAAFATSILAITHPVVILNDASGMIEPIGYLCGVLHTRVK